MEGGKNELEEEENELEEETELQGENTSEENKSQEERENTFRNIQLENSEINMSKKSETVKDKIIKLFVETPRKEFLKLIESVDNKNFGLLLSQILEDYLSLSKKRQAENELLNFNIKELEDENSNMRKQFIKYCFPKVLTTKFSSLEISSNEISFRIFNKWQLIDKDNLKYIKMKNQDLMKEWGELFTSEPYITIMHETENKKQRVFILNKATLIEGTSQEKIRISYQQGMVQHQRNQPLVDVSENYNIDSGVVCIHT